MIPSKEELSCFVNDRKKAAEKYGVTEKTIVNWLKKYNLYEPKSNYGCGKLNYNQAIEIRDLYDSGISMKELSLKYKVTFTTISRVVHNLIYKEPHDTANVTVVYNVNTYQPI